MNTIDNIRWLRVQRERRHRPSYTIAGTVIALAMWAGIIAAVVALL